MSDIDRRPARVNIFAANGDDFHLQATVQDSGGTGYALSAASLIIYSRAGTALVTLTQLSGLTITNPGGIVAYISKTTIATLPIADLFFVFSVDFTASGLHRTLLTGSFIVTKDGTVSSSSTDISVTISSDDIVITIPSGTSWLDTLQEASSDQDAHDTWGLIVGEWYVSSNDHLEVRGGVPVRIISYT